MFRADDIRRAGGQEQLKYLLRGVAMPLLGGLDPAAFAQALDPAAAVAARQGIGGAAPEPLSAMLSECRAALDTYATWCEKAVARTVAAEEKLLHRVQELCGG